MVRDNQFEVPQSDVAAWESVLDLMLQEQELVEVFEAAGLWVEPEAAGAPATTGLRDRQDGRHRGAAAGRNRSRVRPVIPGRLGWERSLGKGV